MTYAHTPATRSYNMSRIRNKDTKPEMVVRRLLNANGFIYRLHDKKLPGNPDDVLPKYKTVIFVMFNNYNKEISADSRRNSRYCQQRRRLQC